MPLDPIALKLDAQYRKGFVPAPIAAQLVHPRQLMAYDTFQRSSANGWGMSDSGHVWQTMTGSPFIGSGSPGIGRPGSSGPMRAKILGPVSDSTPFSVWGYFYAGRGSARNHGIIVNWVDESNHIFVRVHHATMYVVRVVDGESTNVASINLPDFAREQTWDWLYARYTNPWGAELGNVTVGVGSVSVTYGLNSDPNKERFMGHMCAGVYLAHSTTYVSRVFVVGEAGTW